MEGEEEEKRWSDHVQVVRRSWNEWVRDFAAALFFSFTFASRTF